jgi:hypothetical protein
MRLTDAEYKVFAGHFHCTAWPDEHYRVPVNVEGPDGTSSWTTFVAGDQFSQAVRWLDRWRSRSKSHPVRGRRSRVADQAVKRA